MAKYNTGKGDGAAGKAAAEKAAAKAAAEAGAAAQAAKKQNNNVTKGPALSVVSGREGFRRAGRVWGKESAVVKLSDLSDEQIAQIKGESLLAVTEIWIDEEASAE